MTTLEAIEMKRNNEERSFKAREKTWMDIQQVKDELLRKELNKAFRKPVQTGRRSG